MTARESGRGRVREWVRASQRERKREGKKRDGERERDVTQCESSWANFV